MAHAVAPVIVHASTPGAAEQLAASMRAGRLPTVLTASDSALRRAAAYARAVVVLLDGTEDAELTVALGDALDARRPVILVGPPSTAREALAGVLGAAVLDAAGALAVSAAVARLIEGFAGRNVR